MQRGDKEEERWAHSISTRLTNKMVNTYVNYEELNFDSGESYAKLKAKAALPDEFTLLSLW